MAWISPISLCALGEIALKHYSHLGAHTYSSLFRLRRSNRRRSGLRLSPGLEGVVLAVDGVALKQAVDAWASAPDAEKAARFASAEAIRWLEWGARSYENFALGLAVLLFAAAVVRTTWVRGRSPT
jgi:hypothetical protein